MSRKEVMKAEISPEMVQALRDIVHHKVEMWNASSRLEALCGLDIDVQSDLIEGLAITADSDDVDVTEEDMRRVLEDSQVEAWDNEEFHDSYFEEDGLDDDEELGGTSC